MDITPLVKSDQQIIKSYAGGVFKVNNSSYSSAIIVTSDKTMVWDIMNACNVSDLVLEDFNPLIENLNDIDVVLLGAGKTMAFVLPKLRDELKGVGLSVDIMDSGAACRTYNVLMAEGRRVAAALLPAI